MRNREEFIDKLKADLATLNAHLDQWEAKARSASAQARIGYERQIGVLREQRRRAMLKLREVQSSSSDAWHDMADGADAALRHMRDAFEKARARFERDQPERTIHQGDSR